MLLTWSMVYRTVESPAGPTGCVMCNVTGGAGDGGGGGDSAKGETACLWTSSSSSSPSSSSSLPSSGPLLDDASVCLLGGPTG